MTISSTCPQPKNTTKLRHVLSSHPHPLQKVDQLAVVMPFGRGQEVYNQGEPADYWYFVISGAARRCVIRPDGRRQIIDLLLSGDFFGFTAGDEYEFSVEAIAKGTLLAAYPRRRVEMAADSDPDLAREIRRVTFEAMSRLQAQLLILGRIRAPEKVGSFILEMAMRLAHGRREDKVALPVTRYDIAEYLAVSVETVSRSLTDLKQRGLIAMSGTRKVKILDRGALEDCERGAGSRTNALSRRRTDPNLLSRPDESPAPRYG